MRILHILFWNVVNQVGGTEIYLKKMLDKQKHENECHVLMPGKGKHYLIEDIYYFESSLLQIHGDFNFINGIKTPKNFKDFKEYINNLNPDTVYFHCFWPKFIHYLKYFNELKIQTFIIPHLSNFTCLRGDLMQNGKTLCNGKVEINKCLSCYVKSNVKKRFYFAIWIYLICGTRYRSYYNINLAFFRGISKKFQVVNFINNLFSIAHSDTIILPLSEWYLNVLKINGFQSDSSFFNKTNLVNQLVKPKPKSMLKLLFVGRLTKSKGVEILEELVNKIDSHLFVLTIIGPEDNEKAYNNLFNKSNVKFLGTLGREEIDVEMRNSDLLIVPSISIEMRPLVLLEAVENNLYPIGSNIGGIKDIIEFYGGELFEVGNTRSLQETILKFLK